MKKIALFIAAFSLALSMPSCNLIGSGSDDKDAVYEDDPIEINEADVIDPNDEEAFEKYGISDEEEPYEEENAIEEENQKEETVVIEEEKETSLPSNTDMVNVKLTSSRHVDMLLDQFDADINKLPELLKDQAANAGKIETLMDHIVKITERINEAAEDGLVSEAQLARYQKQADDFLSIVNENK